VWVRSAGDNDSTAVKATDDQLAARRAFRAKHPRAPHEPVGGRDSTGAAPIDPSLGTGLIDNIICEPEDGGRPRDETADDVLDRYGRAADDNETSRGSAAATATPADLSADDELDEIELQLRLQHAQPVTQATTVGPRGTADLAPDACQTRTRRRRAAPHSLSRREGLAARPLAIAAVVVAAIVASAAAVVQSGGSSHHAPSAKPHRVLDAKPSATATVTAGQLTSAGHLRAMVAINAEKTAAARAAAKERRARARTAHRRAALHARERAAARAAAATHPTHITSNSASASPHSESQPTADGGSATTNPSSTPSRHATPAAPAGPTGGIGSISGGCTPQC
jgi:hypothetical protein